MTGNPPDTEKERLIQEQIRQRQEEAEKAKADQEKGEGPIPLCRALEPSKPFPVEALPPTMRDAVYKLYESIKAPLPMCAQSILAAASLAAQSQANATIDGRVYPLSEFYLTIGESGERKSAVDEQALKSHVEYQRELKDKYAHDETLYRISYDAWSRAREAAIKKNGDKLGPDAMAAVLCEIGMEPERPAGYVITTSEGTYQGIFNLLDTGQPSIGLFTDEGAALLGGYAFAKENKMEMFGGLSKLWDGRPITKSLGGDGTRTLYGRRVSLHIMMQPSIAATLICDPMAGGQGFLARCLTSWPESMIGHRPYSAINLAQDQSMLAYWATVKSILNMPMKLREGTQNELNLPLLPMSSQAKKAWELFHNEIDRLMAPGMELENIRDLGSKLAEHAVRIAGTLSIIGNVNASEINADAIDAGVAIARFYLKETIRIRSGLEPDHELTLAQKTLDFLHKKWMPKNGAYIDMPSIYQKGPNEIRSLKASRPIIKILEDHYWLKKHDGSMVICGKNRKDVWGIQKQTC